MLYSPLRDASTVASTVMPPSVSWELTETPARQQEIYDGVQHIVRKCAHFCEYTLLGMLLRLCLESWFGNRMKRRHAMIPTAFAFGALYAGTDEYHQILTDGRSGQWSDVLLDCCGVLFGTVLGVRLIAAIGRKQKGAETEE